MVSLHLGHSRTLSNSSNIKNNNKNDVNNNQKDDNIQANPTTTSHSRFGLRFPNGFMKRRSRRKEVLGPCAPRSLAFFALFLLVLCTTQMVPFASAGPLSFPSKPGHHFFKMSTDGSYMFSYDTGPGLHQSFREEKRNIEGTVAGSYGYVDPDGVLRITEYVADSNGYRASLEVYEPVIKFPSGPPLIVGPLPQELESSSEKTPPSENQTSISDEYNLPMKQFESQKEIQDSDVVDSGGIDVKKNFTGAHFKNFTFTEERRPGNEKEQTTESSFVTEEQESLDSDETSFPTLDISTLQEQLKSMALELHKEPLLLIGPIPEELKNLNDDSGQADISPTLRRDTSAQQDFQLNNSIEQQENNILSESTRILRSPPMPSLPEGRRTTLNVRQHHAPVSFGGNFKHQRRTTRFKKVVPLLSELNFVEKDLVTNGMEQISSFMSFPSSNLLQGDYVSVTKPKTKSSSSASLNGGQVKIKKRKLSEKESLLTRLLQPDSNYLFIFEQNFNKNSSEKSEPVNDKMDMKLFSFQARNIFRELLKVKPNGSFKKCKIAKKPNINPTSPLVNSISV